MSAALRLVTPPPADLARANDMAVLWAADDAGLSQAEHRLFCRVYRRYNAVRGCDESLPNMARACQMHEDTARTALRALVARRLIRATDRPGQSKRLDVLEPAAWLAEPAPQTVPVPPIPPGNGGTPSDYPPETEVRVPPRNGGTRSITQEANPVVEGAPAGARGGGPDADPLPDDHAHLFPEVGRLLVLPGAPWGAAGERANLARRALRTGNTPGREVFARLDAWTADHGLRAVLLALLATLAGADPRGRYESRTKYAAAVLDGIAEHRDRTRLQALAPDGTERTTRPRPPARRAHDEARNDPAGAHARIAGYLDAALPD